MRSKILTAVAAALIATASGAPARSHEPQKVRIHVRPQGGPSQLRKHDFRASLNGEKAVVLGAKTPRDDQLIIVVLDLSEDLTEAGIAKQALIEAIRGLPPRTYVAVLRAQDGPIVLADPTADRSAVVEAIEEATVNGRAALLDTLDPVESLADAVSDASGVRVAVLYITDSDVSNYREDLTNPIVNSSDPHDLSRRFPEALVEEKIDKMHAMLADRRTPLFIVHLEYRTSKVNSAYQAGLKTLADALGGSAYFCASLAEIPTAIEAALTEIGSEYLLTVTTHKRLPSSFPVRVEADGAFLIYRSRLVLHQR